MFRIRIQIIPIFVESKTRVVAEKLLIVIIRDLKNVLNDTRPSPLDTWRRVLKKKKKKAVLVRVMRLRVLVAIQYT